MEWSCTAARSPAITSIIYSNTCAMAFTAISAQATTQKVENNDICWKPTWPTPNVSTAQSCVTPAGQSDLSSCQNCGLQITSSLEPPKNRERSGAILDTYFMESCRNLRPHPPSGAQTWTWSALLRRGGNMGRIVPNTQKRRLGQ